MNFEAGLSSGGAFLDPNIVVKKREDMTGGYEPGNADTIEISRQNQKQTLKEIRADLHNGSILEAPMTENETSTCMIYRPSERVQIKFPKAKMMHQFKSKGAVIFPLPQGITDSVKPTWEQGSAQWKAGWMAAANLGNKSGNNRMSGKPISDTVSKQGGTSKGFNPSGFLRSAEGLLSVLKVKGLGSEVMKHRSEILNTHEEHYFKGVEFRSWTFTHKLVARSLNESLMIAGIIDFMQFWASPRYRNGGTHIEYPAEFKIDFCHEGKPNPYLPVINQCVCEGIDINYAPDGNQFFESGASTSVEIVINMKEAIIRTRDHIQNNEVDNRITDLNAFDDRHNVQKRNVQKRRSFYDSDLRDSRYLTPGYGGN